MHHHKRARIVEIEEEHGLPIEQVFKDYAKLYSWHFTCLLVLGCGLKTFEEYKQYFTKWRSPAREHQPHVIRSNKARAKLYEGLTIAQIMKRSGLARSTVVHRLNKLKWPVEKVINTRPAPRGDITRFKGRDKLGRERLKEIWRKM